MEKYYESFVIIEGLNIKLKHIFFYLLIVAILNIMTIFFVKNLTVRGLILQNIFLAIPLILVLLKKYWKTPSSLRIHFAIYDIGSLKNNSAIISLTKNFIHSLYSPGALNISAPSLLLAKDDIKHIKITNKDEDIEKERAKYFKGLGFDRRSQMKFVFSRESPQYLLINVKKIMYRGFFLPQEFENADILLSLEDNKGAFEKLKEAGVKSI